LSANNSTPLKVGLLVSAALVFVLPAGSAGAHSAAQTVDASSAFAPLEQWKNAVIAGNSTSLLALYSTNPPAEIQANGAVTGADADVNFWLGLKARSMKLKIVRLTTRPGAQGIIFEAEVQTADGPTFSVTDAQGWRLQGIEWRIVGAQRTDAPHLQQPPDMKKDLYPADADAHAEIREAEKKAAAGHKRVLLVFGANWCFDCHVLDLAFHRPDFASAMVGYEVVHVDIGDDGKKNADVAEEFQTPLDKGVPVLAVIDSNGKIVVSQKNGEFEDARSLTPEALLAFLNKWKPEPQ